MFLGPKWERVGGEESGSQRTEASTLPRHRTAEGELLTGWVGVLLTAPGQGKGVELGTCVAEACSARRRCWGMRAGWGPEGWLGALEVAA